jgi:hypothetical protein
LSITFTRGFFVPGAHPVGWPRFLDPETPIDPPRLFRPGTMSCPNRLEDALELLKDGKWHDIDEIMKIFNQQRRLIKHILCFYEGFGFIEFDNEGKSIVFAGYQGNQRKEERASTMSEQKECNLY